VKNSFLGVTCSVAPLSIIHMLSSDTRFTDSKSRIRTRSPSVTVVTRSSSWSFSLYLCNIPGYPSSGPKGCQVTTAQCTPTHHPSLSIHTGWVVASGNRTPNLTFNTFGSPADDFITLKT